MIQAPVCWHALQLVVSLVETCSIKKNEIMKIWKIYGIDKKSIPET